MTTPIANPIPAASSPSPISVVDIPIPLGPQQVIETAPVEVLPQIDEEHILSSNLALDKENQKETDDAVCTTSVDDDCVDWAGPNDPSNPVNWASRKKAKNLAIICYLSFLT